MRRRAFIALAGSAALVRPSVAQQSTKRPVIGLLSSVSFESYAARVTAFRQGLNDVGFVEGTNVTVEYRSADGQVERLAMLAAELVHQQVDAIVTIGGEVPARAAKTATSTIPIVFAAGGDAVDVGLVTSLSRPEANSTGVSFLSSELGPKRLELLRELLPQANLFAYLTGPTSTTPTIERYTTALTKAVHNMGLQGIALSADTEQKIEEAFATMVERRVDGLVVENDAFLNSRRDQIVTLATHHAVPAMFAYREHILAGGLISYGTDLNEMYRQAGIYTGRILKGAKPSELPVQEPTKFELLINLKTAKALGLTIPQSILLRADEVIE